MKNTIETRLGLFFALALCAIVIVLEIAGGTDFFKPSYKLYARFNTVLELKESQWTLSFQSRFGKARWLEPSTDRTLQQLGKQRLGLLDVICPGFAVDCLETLEEIAIGGSEIFRDAGGGELRYIGALNGTQEHACALAQIALGG